MQQRNTVSLRRRYALGRLNAALAENDESEFDSVLDELLRDRESTVLQDVTSISRSLGDALERFQLDSRVARLAAMDIPDARLRLDHVLAMTEEAAHRTLDLVEKSIAPANEIVRGAREFVTRADPQHENQRGFLETALRSAEQIKANLTEVMLAQGVQDLTGQILHSVRKLIVEVEGILEGMVHVTADRDAEEPPGLGTRPAGPAIPGITRNAVIDQNDVDDLIAGLGI